MKKIVVIMLLFFAFSLQANTINGIEKQEVKKELAQYNPGTRFGCKTWKRQREIHNADGSIDFITEVWVECDIYAY